MINRFELKLNGHFFEAHNLIGADIKDAEYVVDVEELQTEYKITTYRLKLYNYGLSEDISVGGWTFSPDAKGEYDGQTHYSTSAVNGMTVKIKAISPNGNDVEIHYGHKSDWRPYNIAECFLNGIFLASCCNNEKEYNDVRELLSLENFYESSFETASELFLSFANTISNKEKFVNENQRKILLWLTAEYLQRTSIFFEALLNYHRRNH